MEHDAHQYTGCGLDNIWLINGFEITETAYGEAVSYRDIDGLHRAIGMSIAESNAPLTAAEFKFLRRELDWTQNHLAKLLSVDEQTVGRWEREEVALTGPAQTVIRLLYLTYCENKNVKRIVDDLAAIDSSPINRRFYSLEKDHWAFDEAA
ncbi:MAG: transcriptional regulator [Pseudomonadota bacterium]